MAGRFLAQFVPFPAGSFLIEPNGFVGRRTTPNGFPTGSRRRQTCHRRRLRRLPKPRGHVEKARFGMKDGTERIAVIARADRLMMMIFQQNLYLQGIVRKNGSDVDHGDK